jgi:hypothetical protein
VADLIHKAVIIVESEVVPELIIAIKRWDQPAEVQAARKSDTKIQLYVQHY